MSNITEQLRQKLEEGRIAQIYRTTYASLIDRVSDAGLFPESIRTNGYGQVQYNRSIGAVWALYDVTGQYELFEKVIRFTLDSAKRSGINRISHVTFSPEEKNGTIKQEFDILDQPDGAFHVIGAWANFVMSGHASQAVEDDYYDLMKMQTNVLFDHPYFFYNKRFYDAKYVMAATELRLIFNPAFEHSREGRYWATFDILTQCFGGSALEAMIKVAEKRGDSTTAERWKDCLAQLRAGIDKYMTKTVDGKKIYLEMRLPDSNWGKPFEAFGWPNWAVIAAQWQPLEQEVLDNTIEYVREKLWVEAPETDGCHYLINEYEEDGSIEYKKGMLFKLAGWDIAYSVQKKDYAHVLEFLEFIEAVVPEELLPEDARYEGGQWKFNDLGSGEQNLWWCWGMALLRESLGMPAAPEL